MDRVKVTTTQNVYIDYEAAGVGDRTIAAIFDSMILFSYIIFMFMLLRDFLSTAVTTIILLPYLLYYLLSEILLNGQTIGKKLRGIKVTRLDGTEPRLGDYVIRWLFRLVEIDMCMGLIALLTLIFRGKGQRLGDMAAGTTVVKISRQTGLDQTFYTELDTEYQPVFKQVSQLPDQDIALAKEVLDTIKGERTPTRGTIALGEKMKITLERKMDTTSTLPPREFLETVIKDFNWLRR